MLRIARYDVMNMENALRGARNPMNSWSRSDSTVGPDGQLVLGENDLLLVRTLCTAGSDHRKFLRQIFVSADVEAPLYWWKEYDTYKIATVSNSTSTMHKIHAAPFSLEAFSTDGLSVDSLAWLERLMGHLESLRLKFVATKDRQYWHDIIKLLPSSYNQLRTCTLNYETLVNIYHARKNHKLREWHTFCDWIETLPYADVMIVGKPEA